jgi:hypothetical protein
MHQLPSSIAGTRHVLGHLANLHSPTDFPEARSTDFVHSRRRPHVKRVSPALDEWAGLARVLTVTV